ncbi:hypothetical protein CVT24_006031 [Panaeolus cyanescens]|uniref:F-box domain-containing protein n=1 Tax=Panaeolus cyanescens TaxID=181874 RepID=A0A409YE45_9AGAR|nr:hypothetical protein CVT24_006031 [Panaeolus cyanescens]
MLSDNIPHVARLQVSMSGRPQRSLVVGDNLGIAQPVKQSFLGHSMVIKTRDIQLARNQQHLPTLLDTTTIAHEMKRNLNDLNPSALSEESQNNEELSFDLEKVPTELLIAIVNCASRQVVLNLAIVNKAFYEICMDVLCTEVEIKLTNVVERRKIYFIKNPLLAKRIQHLRLSIDYIGWSSRNHESQPQISALEPTSDPADLDANADDAEGPEKLNFSKALHTFLNAIPNMRNVRTLSLHTGNLPSPFSFEDMVSSIWETWSILENFCYQGNLTNLSTIFRSSPPSKISFNSIELNGTISGILAGTLSSNLPDVNTGNQSPPIDILLSGIDKFSSQLCALSLIPTSPIDFSTLYAKLASCTTPNLNELVLLSPSIVPGHPHGLTNFLTRVSPQLTRFAVRFPGTQTILIADNAEKPWNDSLSSCLAHPKSFARVRDLEIYPTMLDTGLEVLLKFIHNTESHLEKLTITERYWDLTEIEKITSALKACKKLQSLTLASLRYNSALIDVLAQNLPNLYSLHLNIDEHIDPLELRQYTNWHLYDLSISRKGSIPADGLLEELGPQIPSLKSFFGKGHMNLEDNYYW